MAAEFICPCCGFKPIFTDRLAEEVVVIVAEKYGALVEDVKTRKDSNGSGAHNRARAWCIYFLRKFTGVEFKALSYYFDWSDPAKAGTVYNGVEKSLQYKSRSLEAQRIENLLLEKLSISQPA
jgi:hypothetical protein